MLAVFTVHFSERLHMNKCVELAGVPHHARPAVAPEKRNQHELRLGHLVNASSAGAPKVMPAVLSCAKWVIPHLQADVERDAPRMMEMRKGFRSRRPRVFLDIEFA